MASGSTFAQQLIRTKYVSQTFISLWPEGNCRVHTPQQRPATHSHTFHHYVPCLSPKCGEDKKLRNTLVVTNFRPWPHHKRSPACNSRTCHTRWIISQTPLVGQAFFSIEKCSVSFALRDAAGAAEGLQHEEKKKKAQTTSMLKKDSDEAKTAERSEKEGEKREGRR